MTSPSPISASPPLRVSASSDFPRLIEFAFPLKQTSLDSVHEKNVRHGHISTLHIWPARRPLAACRAALIATLLPDPSAQQRPDNMADKEWGDLLRRQRRELCEKIGGTLQKGTEKKKKPDGSTIEREKEITKGGILHWGREAENADTLEWFRQEIRKAYGGRAPKFLDPFAGGGAIPLEAMRLGCEATAMDINPVAWFLLKCTLEFPQKLAGHTRPLPAFILRDRDFMEAFLKSKGLSKAQIQRRLEKLGHLDDQMPLAKLDLAEGDLEADLAWHVRAWGRWVLSRSQRALARFYPTYADFEPAKKHQRPFEPQPMRLLALKDDGTPDIDTLNADFVSEDGKRYLADPANPRWTAKPTVAYLWARTVTCKNCRATIPLLKTRWLCRKENKRVLLTVQPSSDKTGVQFGVQKDVPAAGGNAAQRKTNDKKIGAGTLTKSGAWCPCCDQLSMSKQDIQLDGREGKIGRVMLAVIVEGPKTKEYRPPTDEERKSAEEAAQFLDQTFANLPGGFPTERIELNAKGDTWCILYGKDAFHKLFTPRQLHCLGTFCSLSRSACEALKSAGYTDDWTGAISAYLYCSIARLADRNSEICTWQVGADKIGHTFARYALPFTSDFVEVMPWADSSGGFGQAVEWVSQVVSHLCIAEASSPKPKVERNSAIQQTESQIDIVITDPPYYDSIGYAVVMDFFSIWLKRAVAGRTQEIDKVLLEAPRPKWDPEKQDGELVDDANRFGGDKTTSKTSYETGMAKAFRAAHRALAPEGRMVVVFAHKEPDAWETLVSAIIQAGFVVDASWPIMTERSSRMRSMQSAALSSSVWLVCKKRPENARAGWDKDVIEEMRRKIRVRLNEFWDAGIRGPDFVWAATGPAMEAYSQHPVVLKANQPKERMSVSEFLNHVRRLVVDYIVGQVLSRDQARGQELSVTDRLDEVTAYYLLHRHDFRFDEAPSGACILYAVSCGLSDTELASTWDLIHTTGSDQAADEDDPPDESGGEQPEAEEESGGKMKLKTWAQRKSKSLGYEAPVGKPVPLIDRIHRLMYLWRAGDVHKVDEFLDEHGLRRHELFKRVLQSIIELSEAGGEERSLLESLSNHLGIKGAVKDDKQTGLAFPAPE